jgi:hypothetical protein
MIREKPEGVHLHQFFYRLGSDKAIDVICALRNWQPTLGRISDTSVRPNWLESNSLGKLQGFRETCRY